MLRASAFIVPAVLLLLLLGRSSFFPYPEILTENYFLRQGMLPYSQINDQHFPGILLLPFLTTIGQLRFIHLALLTINVVVLFKLLAHSSAVTNFFAMLTYVFYVLAWEGNTLWIDSLVATLSLFGFYLLNSWPAAKNTTYYFLVGLTFGMAILFKQHALFLCLIATLWVISFRPRVGQFVIFALGGVLPLSLALLALQAQGVLSNFIFWTLTHNLSGYTALEGRAPIATESIKFLSLAIPAMLALGTSKNAKLVYFLYLLSTIFFIFPRFGLIHAQVSLPIMVYLVSRSSRLLLFCVFVISCVFVIRFLARDQPGHTLFYDASTHITVDFVLSRPNPTIYVYGVNDNMYHLTGTLPPTKIWIELLKGNIIPGVEQTLIGTLKADPPQFILVDPQAAIDNQTLPEFTPHLWQYITMRYALALSLSNGVQVWQPKSI